MKIRVRGFESHCRHHEGVKETKRKRKKRAAKKERIFLATYDNAQIMSGFARDDVNKKLAKIGKKDIQIDPLMKTDKQSGAKRYVGFRVYAV